MQFSTFEVDNDEYSGNCAALWGNGGNWNYACHNQNMNGQYGANGDEGHEYMFWLDFDFFDPTMALKSMRWMVREVV